MNRKNLTAMLRHPKRRLTVLIGTFVILLVIIWPAADDYSIAIQKNASLQEELAMCRLKISTIPTLEKKFAVLETNLKKLEEQTVDQQTINKFRKHVVETVRKTGCRVNRLHVQTAVERRWHQKDHPIQLVSTNVRGKPTPYNISSTKFSLSVSGRLQNLKQLLQSIHGTDKLIHSQRFSLRSIGGNRNELIMDIDLQLFGFKKVKQKAT